MPNINFVCKYTFYQSYQRINMTFNLNWKMRITLVLKIYELFVATIEHSLTDRLMFPHQKKLPPTNA